MTRVKDLVTGDLFDIPKPAPATPGSMNYTTEIAALMSAALKECPNDRIEVCARMTRLTGREVTLHMLNAYTAESRETHEPTLSRAIAFDVATEGYSLLNFYANKRGCRVMVGQDALAAELWRIEQEETRLAREKKVLKQFLKNKS